MTHPADDPLREALKAAAVWHEAQDKALSKQPPSAEGQWRRMEHQEQAAVIRAALAAAPHPAPAPADERAAEEAVAIARGESEPASVYPAPQPAPSDREALVEGIAQIIDHPSVYMGGPSRNSLRIAEAIVKEYADALLAVALYLAWRAGGAA